jgi:hypothetical protein
MLSSTVPHQLILFGPPGTSKSRQARVVKAAALGVDKDRMFPMAFHPECSYGEFVARLLPLTRNGKIDYSVYAGPFIRALARAYAELDLALATGGEAANVVLLIDEINRGNCAEIFGDIFQLLDRDDSGWSSYEISTSALIIEALTGEMTTLKPLGTGALDLTHPMVKSCLQNHRLMLPPNLFMIGTMNTSDESVYFMDSAFKRRWNFEFRSVGFDDVPESQRNALVTHATRRTWSTFLDALNQFILEECRSPKLDDKLVGPWFIKAACIVPRRSLPEAYPAEWFQIEKNANGVATLGKGADYSEAFEAAVLDLQRKLPAAAASQVTKLLGFDENADRKFSAIAWNKDSYYYKSSKWHAKPPPGEGVLIEQFLVDLGNVTAHDARYEIRRSDIAGKLFLYLWDNVFDRDKTPLCALLGVSGQKLRTFGQFVDHADLFIEKLHDANQAALTPAAATLTSDAGADAAA